MGLSDGDLERYSRHIILREIGVGGQRRLLAGKVLVIGAGGLGSPAAMYLAAAGVGEIGLADGDEVDLSNLQRQIAHSTADIGRPKVQSAAETLEALNPGVRVNRHPGRVTAADILDLVARYDFVLDGTDNFPAKFLINDACVIAGKPFSHAGIIRFRGQLTTYLPGRGPCYRCLFVQPPPPEAVPSCRQAGVVGALAGVIGCLQALEAIKFLAGLGGLLCGRLLTFDALSMAFREIRVPVRENCAVCGPDPTILRPSDHEMAACGLGE
ncbi:MAG: molybdopterin-synthase adenylyltransferase MoeB [Deltaproteobacteria bacterium]|jgi:molybdopterin/thiamine biosynthesis adenylyltransferase|nr:molybdopterin-synthase adenylyltransferase MoeB [Deltaproteobacteria bacterium]